MKGSTVRFTVWSGCAVLVATAAFHSTGWPGVAKAADEAELSSFLASVVKALWLYASYHWLFVAILAAVAAANPSKLARIVLGLSAALLAADVILLLLAVGPFIGEALLAVSVLTYGLGAMKMPHA